MATQTGNPLAALSIADIYAIGEILYKTRLRDIELAAACEEEVAARLMGLQGQVVRWKRTGNAADAGANAAPSAPVPPPPTAREHSAHGRAPSAQSQLPPMPPPSATPPAPPPAAP
jgi:hypothetical protein